MRTWLLPLALVLAGCDLFSAPDAVVADAGQFADAPLCDPYNAAQPIGHHSAGLQCSNCHDGYHAHQWTVSGTVYDSPSSAIPVSGATVRVTDANNQRLVLVTANNGNFYSRQGLVYPITVSVSLCPDSVAMVAFVPSPGNCNSCHGPGSRVHIP